MGIVPRTSVSDVDGGFQVTLAVSAEVRNKTTALI